MKSPLPCSFPPQVLTITEAQVHVWRAPLDFSQPEVVKLEETLAPDEISCAARFRKAVDRRRFIACRGILRDILSRYVDREAGRLEFCYGVHGKPSLIPVSGAPLLRFSLSHSQGLALLAIARNREVGVDLEHFQTNFAWKEIAKRFFSPREVAVIRSLPVEIRYKAFLIAWTCKEAYAKARGDGLSLPFDRFEVSVAPEKSCSLNAVRSPQGPSRWMLAKFTQEVGYTAALAAEGNHWQLRFWQWPG